MTEQSHITLAAAALGGAIAYGLGANLRVVGAFTVAGGLLGLAASQVASGPGPDAVQALAAKVDELRAKAEFKFKETCGVDLPSLDQTLEVGAVVLLTFWLAYAVAEAEAFDASILSIGGTLIYVCIRAGYFPDPQPAGGTSSSAPGAGSLPSQPYVPPAPPSAPPKPLIDQELADFKAVRASVEARAGNFELHGLKNSGRNNCFINAALQVLIHTPELLGTVIRSVAEMERKSGKNWGDEILSQEDLEAVLKQQEPVDTDESRDPAEKKEREAEAKKKREVEAKRIVEAQRFYVRFILLLDAYSKKDSSNYPLASDLRPSVQAPKEGYQACAGDVLVNIGNVFDFDALNWEWSQVYKVDLDQTVELTKHPSDPSRLPDPAEYSEIDLSIPGFKASKESGWCPSFASPNPTKAVPLQSVLDFWTQEKQIAVNRDSWTKFLKPGQRDKVWEAPEKSSYIKIVKPQDTCFAQFKAGRTSTGEKIPLRMQADSPRVKIDGKDFALNGFVVHTGGTTGGHWIAYVQKGGKWHCADDEKISEADEKSVLKQLSNAPPFGCFSKIKEDAPSGAGSSPASSGSASPTDGGSPPLERSAADAS